ncbi:MAG: hypothetical protein PVI43_02765 [Candidatus Bathyarchaeota archaeon]
MVTEIRNFYSLRDLSEELEEQISFYKYLSDEYGQRLGSLLREKAETDGDKEWFKELSGFQNASGDSKSKGKGKKKGKKAGWVQFKDLMLSTEDYGEAQILFDAIEEIRDKVVQLEKILGNIEDLKRLGLGENIVYIAYLNEGVPEKIVLNKEPGDEFGKKFEFLAKISLSTTT